jgi:hypothetical protein
MYNGGNGNGKSGGHYPPPGNTGNVFSVGRLGVKPLYVYLAVGVLLLLCLYFLSRIINTSLIMHFGLAAGVMLLWANGRAFLNRTPSYVYVQAQPDKSTALLNTLIGGALISAWLSQIASVILWVPALLLFGLATPLALGKTHIYDKYAQTASRVTDRVRRTVARF